MDLSRILKAFEKPASFRDSYSAGYDCGMYGPSSKNCDFRWFNSPESTKEWERGKKDGEKFK